jgi:hypothetical protein
MAFWRNILLLDDEEIDFESSIPNIPIRPTSPVRLMLRSGPNRIKLRSGPNRISRTRRVV